MNKQREQRNGIRAVDRDPALQQVLSYISELSAMQIERKCGVSAGTIRNWRNGKTRRPQNLTLEWALRSAGFKRIVVPK